METVFTEQKKNGRSTKHCLNSFNLQDLVMVFQSFVMIFPVFPKSKAHI